MKWDQILKLTFLFALSCVMAACGGQPGEEDEEDIGSIAPFSILGVQGGTDVTADPYLTSGNKPHVSWEATNLDTGYSAEIQNNFGSVVCSPQSVSGTQISFDSCNLTEGDTYTAHVFANTPAGSVPAENSPFAFTVDSTSPESAIDVNPSLIDSSSTPSFEFSGTDSTTGLSIYQCRINGGGWFGCTSPFTTSTLSDGANTFEVRSFDGAGNSDASPASYAWTVDATEPETSIDSNPPALDNDTTPTFTFSGSDATSGVSGYECQIDSGGWFACTSPHTFGGGLGDGAHDFDVRATDNAGNTDSSVASYSWTINNTAPDPFAITGVEGGTDTTADAFLKNGVNAHVYWGSSSGATNYDVVIRNAADSADVCATQNTANTNYDFSGCTLVEGTTYLIKVTAHDAVPNSTTASNNPFSFIVDSTAPDTTIDIAPSNPDGDASPSFTFSGSDSGSGVASFECRLDAGAWGPCTSPQALGPLASGSHTFDVRAIDQAGFTDASPASHTWQVDVTNPLVSIDSAPSDPDTDDTPTFTFSGSDAHSGLDHFECRIDGGAWSVCASSHTVTPALGLGSHTFDVRAHDVVGNTATDSHTWTLNAATYTIGGSIGDHDHGTVVLNLNGSENLNVPAGSGGNFVFTTELASGAAYAVTISSTPSSPSVPCTLTNDSGNMPAANVTNLVLDCADLQTVTVSAGKSTLVHPDSTTLTASGLYDDGISRDLTSFASWSSTNAGVFTIAGTTVNSVAAGTALAQASFAGSSDTQSITVQSATLLSINVTPGTPDIFAGGQLNLTATGLYDNGSAIDISESVAWSSNATGVATVSDTSGTKGLTDGVSAGTATISAQLSGVTGSTDVTVNAVTLTGLQVTPFVVNGPAGTYADFEATGLLSDGGTVDLTAVATWTSDDTDVALVQSPGRIALVAAGNANVSASYGGQNDSASVTVSGATLMSIAISGSSANLPLGSSMQLTAMGTFSDSSVQDITDDVVWSSADESLLSVSNANGSEGLINGLDASGGAIDITASLNGVNDVYSVDVTTATLVSIAISPPELMISRGVDVNFQATGTYSDATEIDITEQVVWSSSNTSLATIGSGGAAGGDMDNLYTGTNHQSFNISASLNGVNQNANIIITPADLTGVSVIASTVISNTGRDINMRAYGVYDDGGSSDLTDVVTWSSSDEAVAKVSNGATSAGLAQTLTEGTATVSATINGVTGNSSMVVDNAAPEFQSDTGIGLTGYYHNGNNFEVLVGQRIDSTIDYDWASGTAPLGVDNNFSIRFQGQIKALYSETYTFCMRSDDGIRLKIDGVYVVQNWTLHAPREDCGNIALTAGTKYDIEIEFFENGGQAVVEMRWQSASQAKVIVPSQYLYPVGF